MAVRFVTRLAVNGVTRLQSYHHVGPSTPANCRCVNNLEKNICKIPIRNFRGKTKVDQIQTPPLAFSWKRPLLPSIFPRHMVHSSPAQMSRHSVRSSSHSSLLPEPSRSSPGRFQSTRRIRSKVDPTELFRGKVIWIQPVFFKANLKTWLHKLLEVVICIVCLLDRETWPNRSWSMFILLGGLWSLWEVSLFQYMVM